MNDVSSKDNVFIQYAQSGIIFYRCSTLAYIYSQLLVYVKAIMNQITDVTQRKTKLNYYRSICSVS
jgi:hypothetical protein